METNKPDITLLPPPPSVFKVLIRGFNVVASHIYLVFLPIAIDLFLWLGPHAKANSIFGPAMDLIKQNTAELPAEMATALTEITSNFNLFSLLRTFPVGVYSLFSASLAGDSPLPERIVLADLTPPQILWSIVLVNIIGIILGTIYFSWVSRTALVAGEKSSFPRQLLNVIILNIGWTILFALMYIPVIIVFFLLALVPDPFRTILGFVLMVPASWFAMFYFYSFFPLFMFRVSAWGSITVTWKIIRYGLPTLGWFSIITLMLSQAMDYLWRSAPASSWMTSFGIFGHGFIATGILAATFIYFVENILWVDNTLKRFNIDTQTINPANE